MAFLTSAANAFLLQFIETYNKRFAVAPANPIDVNRAAAMPKQQALNLIFSKKYTRKIPKNLEISYNGCIYQIQTNKSAPIVTSKQLDKPSQPKINKPSVSSVETSRSQRIVAAL